MLDHLPLVPMGLFMFRFSTANYMPLTVIPGLRSGSLNTELIPEDVPLVWMTRFIFRMVMKENPITARQDWGKKWEFIWRKDGFDSYVSVPAIGDDGTVYFGTEDNKLYAVDGKTGTKKWEFETGGSVSSPVIGDDGTLYIGSGDKKIYAIKTDSKGPAKSPWPMRGQNA
ncbi:uncharacterized protein METZ01_LOCUS511913, partial [marine metagenome]